MNIADELADFIESGVSISLASCSAALLPAVSRAKGCRVVRGSPGRLRLLVAASECPELIDAVRSTHALAVTFSHPTRHRTLQFKGRDARVDLPEPLDLAAAAAYERSFGETLAGIGFPRAFTHAFLSAGASDLQVLEFTPTDAFQQTPGPGAGTRVAQP